jgi:dihydroorotate dehydrogenase
VNALFGLGQTLLQALDPERAHDLAILSLELGLYPRASGPDDPRLGQTLLGHEFRNPLGMAPGFDKNARVPEQLLAMGFGFAEVGTVTPEPQPGNPKPRIFRSAGEGAIINRLGFNNEGLDAVRGRLKKHRSGIVGVNLGANKTSEDRIADYVRGLAALGPFASYVTINISSPNTPGLRDWQSPEALDQLLAKLELARKDLEASGETAPPVLIKLAPDLDDEALPETVAAITEHGVDGIIVSNTTLSRDGVSDVSFAAEAGGLSGKPLFWRATRMLARIYKLTGGKLPLIGVGGIDSGEAALAKIEAGASLLQLYTALVFQGPALIGAIKRALLDKLKQEKLDSLTPLIGRRAEEWAERGLSR